MGWRPNHGRIKPKYNPIPNAEERRHEQRLEKLPCIGCGRRGGICHHTLLSFPAKRFRRDHRFQVPVCNDCHADIHAGREAAWWERHGKAEQWAVEYIIGLWEDSQSRAAA